MYTFWWVYMYIYMDICMYRNAGVNYVCIFTYIYIYIYICMYECMCVFFGRYQYRYVHVSCFFYVDMHVWNCPWSCLSLCLNVWNCKWLTITLMLTNCHLGSFFLLKRTAANMTAVGHGMASNIKTTNPSNTSPTANFETIVETCSHWK